MLLDNPYNLSFTIAMHWKFWVQHYVLIKCNISVLATPPMAYNQKSPGKLQLA